jgi:hypothetical protein
VGLRAAGLDTEVEEKFFVSTVIEHRSFSLQSDITLIELPQFITKIYNTNKNSLQGKRTKNETKTT